MHMHNIKVTTSTDGDIVLTQSEFDSDDKIYLHPEQLLLIARREAGLSEATANQVADLERKIGVLTTGLSTFVCDSAIRSEIIKYCPSSFEWLERLDGLLNLALEFEGHLTPECMERGIETPILVAPSPMHTEQPTKSTKNDPVRPGGTPDAQLPLIDQA